MDAILRKCLACGDGFTAIDRRSKLCPECRKNPSDRQSYQTGENVRSSCLQPIDFVEAKEAENQEFQASRSSARSPKQLSFEKSGLGTLKLTDGTQINTGYGRASIALGYVMEIVPGRWVARVRDLSRDPLPLGAAKKAAIALYRSRGKGEPDKDWIDGLNQLVADEVDRTYWAKEKRKWPLDLMGGRRHRAKKAKFEAEHRETILDTERVLLINEKPKEALADTPLDYYEDGYPKLPACLDRTRKLELAA